MRYGLVLLLIAALPLVYGGGCGQGANSASCGELPDPSTCPIDSGGSCSDASCSAIYECNGGAWQLVNKCPSYEGGVDPDGGADGGDAAVMILSCPALSTPPAQCDALQLPDCDDQIAFTCAQQACAMGCEDFLHCGADGWEAAESAYCDDQGLLIFPDGG